MYVPTKFSETFGQDQDDENEIQHKLGDLALLEQLYVHEDTVED